MGRKKETCPQGHPYDETSYFNPTFKGRVCRICKRTQDREAQRRRRARLKAERDYVRDAEGRWVLRPGGGPLTR